MTEIFRYFVECSRCHKMKAVLLERKPTETERQTFTCMECSKELKGNQ